METFLGNLNLLLQFYASSSIIIQPLLRTPFNPSTREITCTVCTSGYTAREVTKQLHVFSVLEAGCEEVVFKVLDVCYSVFEKKCITSQCCLEFKK